MLLFILISAPCFAQWRNIGFGNPNGGDFFSGVPLAICAHDSCVFVSLSQYLNAPLIFRYTASLGWKPADTGIDATKGSVNYFASLGPYIIESQGDNRLMISSDDGSSWSEGNATGPVASNGTYMFGGLGTSLAVSKDSDKTWNRLPLTLSPSPINYCTMGACIFANASSGIYRSTDSGNHWSQTKAPPAGLSLSSFAVINSQLFAGGSGIFHSTDSGLDWTQFSLANRTVNALASYKTYLFAGTDTGVFISFDSGVSWRNVSNNMGAQPNYHPNVKLLCVLDTFLFASVDAGTNSTQLEHGYVTDRPISEMTDTTKSVVETVSQPPADSIEVFPNPATGLITIRSGSIPIEQVSVINLLGVYVLDLPNLREPEITLDISKLPSGSYFLQIETVGKSTLRRVSVIH